MDNVKVRLKDPKTELHDFESGKTIKGVKAVEVPKSAFISKKLMCGELIEVPAKGGGNGDPDNGGKGK